MDGKSLWPVLSGPDAAWDRPVLIEAWLSSLPRGVAGFAGGITEFGVRTGRYKYIRYSNGAEELYDLGTDPNELTGRQRDPAYADAKAQMLGLWRQYAGCRGAACNAPLPAELQTDTSGLYLMDLNAATMWNDWYNR